MEEIFNYEFQEEENMEKIRIREAEFLKEVETIENWEEKFVTNNGHLEPKFVRVFDE
jgi:hypothetical protein